VNYTRNVKEAFTYLHIGCAIAQAVSRWLPGLDHGSGQVGFVVDKVALGQVFSEYFAVSPANFHSTNCSSIALTYHLGLVQ
jgi:hypothetical protein